MRVLAKLAIVELDRVALEYRLGIEGRAGLKQADDFRAAYFGGELGLNIYVIWIAAIALTIALGLLFAPLERIRLPKRKAG